MAVADRRQHLRRPTAAQFAGHQPGDHHHQGLRQGGKEAHAGERRPEEFQRDAAHERRQGRIGHIAPGEVAGVAERGQLVAVKAVFDRWSACGSPGGPARGKPAPQYHSTNGGAKR